VDGGGDFVRGVSASFTLGRLMVGRIGIWSLRILLALAFVFFGIIKFPSDDGSMWVRTFERIGFGQWFRYFTGVVEILGGVLLLVPRATLIVVVLLAPTMVGALLSHIFIFGFQPASVVVVILLALILAVGWKYRPKRLYWNSRLFRTARPKPR
jgi:uncharacterized membrane protein YphA (DoxX/SURF4 family)